MTNFSPQTLKKYSARPTLCFDQAGIQNFMVQVQRLGKKYRTEFLSPAKALPHPTMFKMIADHLAGFDVSNPAELKRTLKYAATVYSLDWKSQPWKKNQLPKPRPGQTFFASTEDFSVFQQMAKESFLHSGLRLDPFSVMPAPLRRTAGPVSRFGRSADEVMSFLSKEKPARFGLHLHLGGEQNQSAHYLAMARGACRLAKKSGGRLDYLNLGGGLAAFDLASLEQLLIRLRKIVPRSTRLIFEPGRLFSERFGYAVGRVESVRVGQPTQYRLSLSRECHLRWGRPVLCEIPVMSQAAAEFLFMGSSSFESDQILQLELSQGHFSLQVGDPVVFGHVAGYCVAWNKSFNGIPTARVEFFKKSVPRTRRGKKSR
jgi:diaminopimelate decarboxylase